MAGDGIGRVEYGGAMSRPQGTLRNAGLPLQGPFTRWPQKADAVLAIVLFLASVFVTFEGPDDDLVIRAFGDVPIAAYIILAVVSLALV